MKILCGCDPEVAVIVDGAIVPVCGKIPGTKAEPFAIEGSTVGLKIQEDNVSLEFNIDPVPLDSFAMAANTAYKELRNVVTKYFGKNSAAHLTEGHIYTDEQLIHPSARAFGCDPDFLAHERGTMRTPLHPTKVGNARFFAGHLHIGYDKDKCPIPDWAIVQGMELGGYLHMVNQGMDMQAVRRKNYGLAGLFRPKPYGLEYRTPSNFWLRNPNHAATILKAAQTLISRPAAYRTFYDSINWKDVADIINSDGTVRGSHIKCETLLNQWYDFEERAEELA